jgi:hypothetical protein
MIDSPLAENVARICDDVLTAPLNLQLREWSFKSYLCNMERVWDESSECRC